MTVRLLIVLAYLALTVAIGLLVRTRSSASTVEFLLAGRGLGRVLLFITMAATNFSAYTIFGLSGAGYRIGWAYYPVMSFGTGFMALALYGVGRRILVLSKERGYVTPTDFMADRYGSRPFTILFSVVLIVFTLPYIAIQAVAAGKSLESLVGVPYAGGVLLVTGCIVAYVALGGLRSVAWTDVVQALMMVGFTFAAFVVIARAGGGFARVSGELAAGSPGLFSRPGLDGSMQPGVWFGFLFLWFFADPMFPQLFQKLIAARDARALKTTVVCYPLITAALFFLTVGIGVMGRAALPGLSASQSESVFPMLLARYASPALGTLLLTGSLAALMSTMDSQLLTLASLFTHDLLPARRRGVAAQRLAVVVLGCLGVLIAMRPPTTILDFMNRSSFTALAVLAPSVFGGLYWRGAGVHGAWASIVTGEALVLLFYFGVIVAPGVQPVVPCVSAAAAVFVLGSLLAPSRMGNPGIVEPLPARAWLSALPFAVLFLLANDFWAWGRTPRLFLGLPLWVWYSIGLCIALSVAFAFLLGRRDRLARGTGERAA